MIDEHYGRWWKKKKKKKRHEKRGEGEVRELLNFDASSSAAAVSVVKFSPLPNSAFKERIRENG